MKRQTVTARMVKSIGWKDNVLEVEYLSGLIHHYHEVTEAEYISSLTGNVDKKIRLIGKSHPFTRVEESG